MIYVTGDTHGDINFFKSAKLKKLTEDDTLIICGDFGFLWNGSDKEKKALDILKKKKYTICFVDGAHENYEMLATYQPYRFKGGNANKIADNIFRLLRGEIFTFEGKTWWKEEMPSTEELMNGAQNLKDNEYKIDYVLTYEAPALAKDFIRLHTNQEMHLTPLNNYLQELMKSVEYEHWYFGSLHMDLNISKKMTAVFNEVIAIK